MADFDVSLKLAEHVDAFLNLARERGFTIDEEAFRWGFAEGLSFTVEHPELAGYYVQLMRNALGPRMRDLLSSDHR